MIKKFYLCLFIIFTILSSAYATVYEHDETNIVAPLRESNETELLPVICKTRIESTWDYCSNINKDDSLEMKSFKFMNWGENPIVPHSGYGIGREFEFLFEGLARSDLGLLVWDTPDQSESHGHLKLIMFFPRLVLPAIKINPKNQDELIVTLPTKEEVYFNRKTKEIINGALIEYPMRQNKNGEAINPRVYYNGNGVSLEADRVNDYPVGFMTSAKNNLATIRKKGFKNCTIPTQELWYTDDNKGGAVFFNKKYTSDDAFEALLKKKCHFSLY